MMKNINDIAEITGYSKSTVSRALNHKGRISQKTRDEIIKVAKEVNYSPNSKAVSLSTGKSYTLGVIVPYSTFNSYYDKIMHSIINEAFSAKYKVTFLPTNYDKDTELNYLRMLQTKEFDGLIIVSAVNDYNLIAGYLEYGTIISCEETGNSGVASVMLEKTEGFARVLEVLNDKGIKCIGICFSRTIKNSYIANKVFKLFDEKVIAFNKKMIFENCRNYFDGINAAKYFINISPKIEAIFASSDEVAAGIIKYYQEFNVEIPILIGQENQSIGEFLDISTIDFRLNELGSEAVKMCLNKSAEKKILKSEIIIRGNMHKRRRY